MSDEGTQGTATGPDVRDVAAAHQGQDDGGASRVMDRLMREPPRPGSGGGPDERRPAAGPAERQSAPKASAGDSSAEELLAEAVENGDGDDLATQLAKLQKQNADLKKHNRTWETRAKENADKAKNFDAYEESQKTEFQRVSDQLAAAQKEAQDAREDRFRLLAAAQYDLPPSLIAHLGGGTEDEITERAEAFAQAINERAAVLAAAQAQAAAQEQPRNGNGAGFRPVESLRPGALPACDNRPAANPNEWFRGMLASSKRQ